MKVTEDMKADRDWLVTTLGRTVGGNTYDQKVAWNDLAEAGWTDVFARISGTWRLFDDQRRPTNRMPYRDQHALLQTCGVFKAGLVLSALELWIASPDGTNPPAAADIYQLIAQPKAAQGATNQPQDLRRDQQPQALTYVATLIGRGELICECHPAPATLVQDGHDTLWCPECGGLERGQADDALEHRNPTAADPNAPVHDLSAVLRLKRIRGERQAA